MPEPPRTPDAVLDLVRRSALVEPDALAAFVAGSGPLPPTAPDTATRLVQNGILTPFQARLILQGRYRGFRLGPYKILDQIGAGGMGQVFLAEHTAMRRKVALKVLPPKLAADRVGVERFYREARAVAALDHPNIVRAHDVAKEGSTHYLVMEYVEGQNLDERVRAAGGRLPVGPAVGYVVQAAAGLQHAHEKGLVHRDVKPGNLLVDRAGVVKILDMGLARFFEDDADKLTRNLDDGAVMGTADYVAPEQLANTAPVDHRADIYALGATLYHLVTGRPPFEGSTAAKLVAHQMRDPVPANEVNPAVPGGLAEVIRGMMAKNPDDRYQSAAGVVHDLLPFVSEGPAGPGSGTSLPPIALAAVSQTTASLQSALLRPHDSDRLPPLDGDRSDTAALARARTKKRLAVAGLLATVLAGGGLVAYVATHQPEAVVTPDPEPPAPPDQAARPPEAFPPSPPPAAKAPAAKGPAVLTPVYKLAAGTKAVEAAAFTPDGRYLLTAGGDALVRVWDAATGKPVRDLKGHAGNVRGLSLLPGGRRVLSAGRDETVRLWDVDTGDLLRTYQGPKTYFTNVAALPNGRRFLTAGDDGVVRLWDTDAGTVLKEYPKEPVAVYGLAVTRDGRRAVAGTWEPKRNAAKPGADLAAYPPVSVWSFEIDTGKELRRVPVPASVSHLQVSPDSRLATFGTADGVAVWELESGALRKSGAELGGRVTAAGFTRDGRHVLATGHDKNLSLWSVATLRLGSLVPVAPGPGYNVAAAPDGRRVAAVGGGGLAAVWQLPGDAVAPGPNPNAPRPQAVLTGAVAALEDARFTPDGRAVACSADRTLRVWDPQTGEQLREIALPAAPRGLALLAGDRAAVSFTPEGKVRTYSLADGKLLKTFPGHARGAVAVAALPDGARFLSAGHDGAARLWDADSGAELARFDLKAPGHALAVTPDGGRFLVGCADRTDDPKKPVGSVRVWDVEKRAEVKRVGAGGPVWRVAVSPDGTWAGFGDGNRVRLWNLAGGEDRGFGGPKGRVDGVAFTPDGRYVLAGSYDRALHGWEVLTGAAVPARSEHTGNVRAVAVAADGRSALTSSVDGTAVAWRLPDRMLAK